MPNQVHATLIGDVVASRRAADRARLHRSLRRALAETNDVIDSVQPLEPTVGDEFQGAFEAPLTAVKASLLLRLFLLKEGNADARFGLGFGKVTVLESRTPISQDGPGWWSAREAIERVEELARQGRTEFVRTYLESSGVEHLPREEVAALNSFLLCRDALVAQMKPRSRRLLLGLILEKSQAVLASEEEISQSAVSQNLAGSGAYAIRAAELELEGKLL